MVVRLCTCEDKIRQTDSEGNVTCNTCGFFIEKGLSQIVTDEKQQPCGCHIVTYSDGRVAMTACKIHAPLQEMGLRLHESTQALQQAQKAVESYGAVIMGYKLLANGCARHPSYRPTHQQPIIRSHPNCTCQQVRYAKLYLDVQTQAVEAQKNQEPAREWSDAIMVDAAKGGREIKEAIIRGEAAPWMVIREKTVQ